VSLEWVFLESYCRVAPGFGIVVVVVNLKPIRENGFGIEILHAEEEELGVGLGKKWRRSWRIAWLH
jgi:hypothetical protein